MTDEISKHLRFWEDSCDISTFTGWCGLVEPWKEDLCKMILELDLKSVLDIGCGTGIMKEILDFYNYSSEYRYLGTEITPKFINLCETKNIPVCRDDLSELSAYRDEEYQCVLCLDVLNHQAEDPLPMLKEITRLTEKLAVVSFFREFRPPVPDKPWDLSFDDAPVRVIKKHDNLIYAEYHKKYIEGFLDTLDVTYEWTTRRTTPGRHPKPPSLFIIKD